MWILITIAVLVFVAFAVYGQYLKVKNARRISAALSRAGIDTSEILFSAAYLCGHPKIDVPLDSLRTQYVVCLRHYKLLLIKSLSR
mgnify:CR=1 FL=1